MRLEAVSPIVAAVSAGTSAHRLFATTVALITSQSDARPNVMACEWAMNVGWHPVRIMAVIHRDELTHELISGSGEFGVNLCAEDQAALSHLAGSVTGRVYDKLADPLFRGLIHPAARIRAPMIEGCVLNVECEVEQTLEIGDYTAFIGRAVAVRSNPELRPLLYREGRYFRMGERLVRREAS